MATASTLGSVVIWDFAGGKTWNLDGHEAIVNELAYSPDGSMVASAGWDNRVILWDSDLHGELRRLESHQSYVNSVAFAPDGRTLASGAGDGVAIVWDVKTGEKLQTIQAHSNEIWQVRFLQEGAGLVTTSMDGTIAVWREGSLTRRLTADEGRPRDWQAHSLAVSPSGDRFATGHADHLIRLWSVNSGELLSVTTDGETPILPQLGSSPAGPHLAVGYRSGQVRIWDLLSSRLVGRLEHHAPDVEGSRGVSGIEFSPDGSAVATAGQKDDIRVWDVESREIMAELQPRQLEERVYRPVTLQGFSSDGSKLGAGHTRLGNLVWEWKAARVLHAPALLSTNLIEECKVMGLAGDGDSFVYVCGRVIGRLSTVTSEMSPVVERPTEVTRLDVNGTGRLTLAESVPGARVRILSTPDFDTQPLTQLAVREGVLRGLRLSPNGNRAAAYFDGARIELWDLEAAQLVWSIKAGPGVPKNVLFNPSSASIVSEHSVGEIRLLDSENGRLKWILQLLPGQGWVIYKPDGDVLSASENGRSFVKFRPHHDLSPLRPIEELRQPSQGDL